MKEVLWFRLALLLAFALVSDQSLSVYGRSDGHRETRRPNGTITLRYSRIEPWIGYGVVLLSVINGSDASFTFDVYSPEWAAASIEVAERGAWLDPYASPFGSKPPVTAFTLGPGATQEISVPIANAFRGRVLRVVLSESHPGTRRVYSEPFCIQAAPQAGREGAPRQPDPARFFCIVLDRLGSVVTDAHIEFLSPVPEGTHVAISSMPSVLVEIVSPVDVPVFRIRVTAAGFSPYTSGPLRLSAAHPEGLVVVLDVPPSNQSVGAAERTS